MNYDGKGRGDVYILAQDVLKLLCCTETQKAATPTETVEQAAAGDVAISFLFQKYSNTLKESLVQSSKPCNSDFMLEF